MRQLTAQQITESLRFSLSEFINDVRIVTSLALVIMWVKGGLERGRPTSTINHLAAIGRAVRMGGSKGILSIVQDELAGSSALQGDTFGTIAAGIEDRTLSASERCKVAAELCRMGLLLQSIGSRWKHSQGRIEPDLWVNLLSAYEDDPTQRVDILLREYLGQVEEEDEASP